MIYGLWADPIYQQTAGIVFAFLAAMGVLLFFTRKKGPAGVAGWASIKSWFYTAPFIFAMMAIPDPFPLIFITFIGVLSAKTFFQMVGAYHRSWFVWITYIFIYLTGWIIYSGHDEFYYNIMPMIFVAVAAAIPLLRNSYLHMVQYMALSLLGFIFWGWSFMHMGRLVVMENGPLIVLYLYILTEFSEHVSLAATRLYGRVKPFHRITPRVTLEGMITSLILTLLLAWAMRHLLPHRTQDFWMGAGLVAAIFGRFGDLMLSVIRRDLGIKNTGVFIIGRGDLLTRVDKLIFVGPMYYYIYLYLLNMGN